MVVFTEPPALLSVTPQEPGPAEKNPGSTLPPAAVAPAQTSQSRTCGVAEVTNTLAIRPFLLYIVSRPQGASGQPLPGT